MTDIYGANLYNRYLAQQNAMTTSTKAVAQGMGTLVKTEAEEQLVSSAAQCRSILVGLQDTREANPYLAFVHRTGLTFLDQILNGHFSRLSLEGW